MQPSENTSRLGPWAGSARVVSGREVDHPRVFDVVLDVLGAGRVVDRVRRGGVTDVARCRLPVHQAQVQCTAANAMDEDALRPQRAVIQALGVGVLQRLRDVAHQLQALRDREVLAVVAQQVIQAYGLGVVIEDQGRAEFGLLVVLDLQDAGVVDAFEDLELAARLANARGADLRARRGGHRVDAHPAVHRVDADVLGFPVLETFTFGQQLAEAVVAHLTVLVGGADAGLGEPARDGASLLRVDGGQRAIGDAVGQRTHDARIVQGAGTAALEGGRLREPLELAGQTGRRKEDRRLDEGQADLGLGDCRLPLQQDWPGAWLCGSRG
jgi:hypothetical protein